MVNKGGGLVQWLTRVWAWCSGYHGWGPSAVVNKGGGLVQWVKNWGPGAVVNKGGGLVQWLTRVGAWCSG